jgi:hypothetical protein
LSGLVLGLGAVIAFGRWKDSPLHLRVCGPNSRVNVRWILYGRRANDNLEAKVFACEMPAGFAEAIRQGFDSNLGALIIERELGHEKMREHIEQIGFGIRKQ